ncbi:MAG: hypothetical protein KAY24_09780 [Candidatus Eisenbacteria sp.]|nr:hypothetical protein [Candidatus Eisenbacteria bacterium]
MRPSSFRIAFIVLLILAGSSLPVHRSGVEPAWAGETGVLKLMVKECGGTWLDNVEVEVTIYRPGTGEIDSDSGYTDVGYIEFEFNDLEDGDEARVTVEPNGSGSEHTYYWDDGSRHPSAWDIGLTLGGQCDDDWYDEEANVILCVCE